MGWRFSLLGKCRCRSRPDPIASGFMSTDRGQAMCVAVETIGDWLRVHRHALQTHRTDRCELVSFSDMFGLRGGPTKAEATWTMSPEVVHEERSKYTNCLAAAPAEVLVRSLKNPEVRLGPFDVSEHNRREAARFADSVARYLLDNGDGWPVNAT